MRTLLALFVFLTFTCHGWIQKEETAVVDYLTEVEVMYPFSGIKLVDRVYIINLDYRFEKWLASEQEFNNYGIHPNRLSAVNGALLGDEAYSILSGHYPVRLRPGQMGCLLSHVSALKDALDNNFQYVWICEDDIKILGNPHILSTHIRELTSLDPSWDVLYTDVDSKDREGNVAISVSSDLRPEMTSEISHERRRVLTNIMQIGQRFGNYSYIVSRKGIEKLLHYFTHTYIWTAYDIDIHYVPGIKEYSLMYDLVTFDWTKPSDTDL